MQNVVGICRQKSQASVSDGVREFADFHFLSAQAGKDKYHFVDRLTLFEGNILYFLCVFLVYYVDCS